MPSPRKPHQAVNQDLLTYETEELWRVLKRQVPRERNLKRKRFPCSSQLQLSQAALLENASADCPTSASIKHLTTPPLRSRSVRKRYLRSTELCCRISEQTRKSRLLLPPQFLLARHASSGHNTRAREIIAYAFRMLCYIGRTIPAAPMYAS